MAQRVLSVRKNADDTVTIKSDNYRESIEIGSKTPLEVYEAIRWAIITADIPYSKDIEIMVWQEIDSW